VQFPFQSLSCGMHMAMPSATCQSAGWFVPFPFS
jgi:hypothetical protein